MQPSIVFFGTGPVSLHCLEGIHGAVTIEAIITKPDRQSPSGQRHDHPVKRWGQEHGIPVHQVAGQAEITALITGRHWRSRLGLVVDFGLIIPAATIESFELGILNSHFSLLPQLRGADPISFAILEGLEQTGVTLMSIVPALDEGPILTQTPYLLPADITTPELTEALGDLSNQLLITHLSEYLDGHLTSHPQPNEVISYTRKLTKADGLIDWHKPAARLEREVRAYLGWPGSRATLWGKEVIITQATLVGSKEQMAANATNDSVVATPVALQPPGTLLTGLPSRLCVATGDGTLELLRLKPAGKREMATAEFLRGRH